MSKFLKTRTFWILLAVAFAAQPGTSHAQSEADTFNDLLFREWEWRLAQNPLFATSVGRHEYDDLLPDVSAEAYTRRLAETRAFLVELGRIDRSSLAHHDQINLDMLRRELELRALSIEFAEYQIPLNADSGFHTELSRLPSNVPFRSALDYDKYIARLRSIPDYIDAQIVNMRSGIARGMTLPQVVLRGIESTIAPHVVESADASVFFEPLRSLPESIDAMTQSRLRAEAASAIMESAVTGYRTFLRFMKDEYIPAARSTLGASALPGGGEYYRFRVRQFTTLSLSPREIHEIGLAEVGRIRAEMEEVIQGTGFEGSFAEFLEFLRTDARFYADTPEQLLKEAAFIAKKMDARLPSLFKTLPRLPYGVDPVPADLAPKYTTGRYVSAPVGSTKPGYYWVNTFQLKSRPLYNMEALTLHEAVPGHHLQIALNMELENLPEFRRYSYISAFGEGWGLYAEWLGLEAGFYVDPYSNFGRLTYEMWRACRLVVDTGLHQFGWTREQTMKYLADNTALPLHEVETETDRYISWPGQALAYKLGELKIKELRRYAEQQLGADFDVREFHDAVLLNGSVPLTVLEEAIHRFVAERL